MLINNPYIPQRECDSNSQLEEKGLNVNRKWYYRAQIRDGLNGVSLKQNGSDFNEKPKSPHQSVSS